MIYLSIRQVLFKGLFVEGPPESICHSMGSFCGSKETSTVHDLARLATSLEKLQRRLHSTDKMCETEKSYNPSINCAHKGGNVNSIRANGSPSLPSSLCTATRTTTAPAATLIWHPQKPHTTFLSYAIVNDDHRRCAF